MLHQRQKVLAMAPSTHDPKRTLASLNCKSESVDAKDLIEDTALRIDERVAGAAGHKR
jgi:hypothetical protein